MGTDNPKVSAYVPQAIKDRLKQFRDEQKLSESQAVTVILAEYFGMTQALVRSPEGLTAQGVTLFRMEALEKKLAKLTEAIEIRFRELEGLVIGNGKASVSPVVHLDVLETQPVVDSSSDNLLIASSEKLQETSTERGESSLDSEPLKSRETVTEGSSLLSESIIELPIQPDRQQVSEVPGVEESISSSSGQEVGEVIEVSKLDNSPPVDYVETVSGEIPISEVESSSSSELLENNQDSVSHHQSELPFELPSELPTEFPPITSIRLSKRIGKGDQAVKHMKRKYKDDTEAFTKWIQGKDPDKIGWQPTVKGYVPIGELTDKQRASLLSWYEEDPN